MALREMTYIVRSFIFRRHIECVIILRISSPVQIAKRRGKQSVVRISEIKSENTDLWDHVTGCPALKRSTSAVSSPRCTSNTELNATYLLSGLRDLSTNQDHATVPAKSGRSRKDKIYDFLSVKMPIIKRRNMTTPQIRRMNVIGQACP